MKKIKSSPILVSKTRLGLDKFWQGHIVTENGNYYLTTTYWQITKTGKESKVQESEPYKVEQKNVGKANETSLDEQSLLEFDSMVKKQRDKGYAEEGTVSTILPLPMLANKFHERKHKLKYPVMVQPKYDGNRMLFDGKRAWSRGGKDIIPEVIAHLIFDANDMILDGELILPDNVPLQDTSSALKKYHKGISEQLLFVVYDCISPSPYFMRYVELQELFTDKDVDIPKNIILAPTYEAKNEAEVMKYHQKFVDDGYEGVIIRDNSDGYDIGHRSNQLQKYKAFITEEFLIKDIIPSGEGSASDVAKFVCLAENGEEFESIAMGTKEQRQEYLNNKKKYIGKYATIKYVTNTKYGVPFHSNVLDIRETKTGGY